MATFTRSVCRGAGGQGLVWSCAKACHVSLFYVADVWQDPKPFQVDAWDVYGAQRSSAATKDPVSQDVPCWRNGAWQLCIGVVCRSAILTCEGEARGARWLSIR